MLHTLDYGVVGLSPAGAFLNRALDIPPLIVLISKPSFISFLAAA